MFAVNCSTQASAVQTPRFASHRSARHASSNGGELIVPPLSSSTLSLDERLTSKKASTGHWKTTCSEIAKLYQLSPRETEVFMLLAKGRNVAFIQEDLVISPHTAKTHIANVYRKLEVHSSQELLDLVESFREAERHLSEGSDE